MQLTSSSIPSSSALSTSDSVHTSSLFVNPPRLDRALTSKVVHVRRSALAASHKRGNISAAQSQATTLPVSSRSGASVCTRYSGITSARNKHSLKVLPAQDKRLKDDLLAVPQHWKEHVAKLGGGKQKALQG